MRSIAAPESTELTPGLRILSPRQISDVLGLSLCTLWRMRRRGELPDPIRISAGRVGWRESDVLAWLKQREAIGR